MYLLPLDFTSKPKLEPWLRGNVDYLKETYPGMKSENLNIKYEKLEGSGSLAEAYQTVTYRYPSGKHEQMLVVLHGNSLLTFVISTKDKKAFKAYQPIYEKMAQSLVIGLVTFEE